MNAPLVNSPNNPARKREVVELLENAITVLDQAGCYSASALVSSAIDEVEAAATVWDVPTKANPANMNSVSTNITSQGGD